MRRAVRRTEAAAGQKVDYRFAVVNIHKQGMCQFVKKQQIAEKAQNFKPSLRPGRTLRRKTQNKAATKKCKNSLGCTSCAIQGVHIPAQEHLPSLPKAPRRSSAFKVCPAPGYSVPLISDSHGGEQYSRRHGFKVLRQGLSLL